MPKRGERYDWFVYVTKSMLLIDTSNKFVKHDVEQLEGQRKTTIHIILFSKIKTKNGEIVESKRLKTWKLVLGSFGFNNCTMPNKFVKIWHFYWMFLD